MRDLIRKAEPSLEARCTMITNGPESENDLYCCCAFDKIVILRDGQNLRLQGGVHK